MIKKIILFSVLVLTVIATGYLLIFYFPDRVINNRCFYSSVSYDLWGMGVFDCYGVISFSDAWDVRYISVHDDVHDYELARINLSKGSKLSDKIKVYGDYMYLINEEPEYIDNSNNISIYHQKLFINNSVTELKFKEKTDMLNYIIVNYKTGEVTAKKSLDEFNISDVKNFKLIIESVFQ